jgi:uncharacterized protein (TIGR03663 family)
MSRLNRTGWTTLVTMLAVTAVALALRTPQLERRPLHNDEANQAAKLGLLLETGVYHYDPHDHHGPTLYYLTWPLARLQSGGTFAATEVWVYRAVPVAFGVLLVLLAGCACDALGRAGATAAGLFTAVSPAMVYFSRFYIQEMLLVTFTFCLLLCLWRWLRTGALSWAAASGASAGLMHATKETCVLAWAALAGAAAVHLLRRPQRGSRLGPNWQHLALAVGVAAVVSTLFFSSFLTYWRGALDAWRAYALFVGRGAGVDNPHQHPFAFYLGILTAWRPLPGFGWGESTVLGLGLVGALAAWAWPGRLEAAPEAVRLLGVYTVLLTLIYSAIPYKTPWCLLSFWHGWILLAGVGAVVLVRWPRRRWQQVLLALLISAGAVQSAKAAWRAAIRYPVDPRNPYVYAQTGTDFLRLVGRLEALSAVRRAGTDLRVHVIAPPDETWPLPWYLRRFTRVGYWTTPEPAALTAEPAVIVTTPESAPKLPKDLLRNYVHEYYGLRPEVLLSLYIRADLWDAFLRARGALPDPTSLPKEP